MTKFFFFNKKFNNFFLMNYLFLIMLFFSTMITINASSWFNAWMGMEMNLMFFMPLMMNNFKKIKISNSMMIYFIIQASSSSFMMMMIIMMKMQFFLNKMNIMMNLIQMSLIMKLGASPFSWWMPKIMKNMNWMTLFIFLTWQKIGPLFLLIINNNNFIIYISAILSSIFGTLMGLNQTMIKMLISYSSINHLGWMMLSMMLNMKIFFLYFIIYSLINLMICLFMNNLKLVFINQLFNYNNQNMLNKIILMSSFLSLAGIPPFLGFLPKFILLIMMIKNKLFIEVIILIIMSVIALSFYINPVISMMIFMKMNFKWNNKYFYINKSIFLIIFFNMFINLIMVTPTFYNLIY
uniref:NADH dehydrogenase subunit 2 n=1 Tax=Cladiucha huangbki TaxID=2735600 RepID=UPI002001BBC9|nr:NADH dehydrogenase subunit 2 [Cladiucha huangbki]UJM44053.1 NADH dehydrogenase subunit 2 [Cladiucha huangbki]